MVLLIAMSLATCLEHEEHSWDAQEGKEEAVKETEVRENKKNEEPSP